MERTIYVWIDSCPEQEGGQAPVPHSKGFGKLHRRRWQRTFWQGCWSPRLGSHFYSRCIRNHISFCCRWSFPTGSWWFQLLSFYFPLRYLWPFFHCLLALCRKQRELPRRGKWISVGRLKKHISSAILSSTLSSSLLKVFFLPQCRYIQKIWKHKYKCLDRKSID